jgi:hypothetical protein
MKLLNSEKIDILRQEIGAFCKLYGYQSCDTKRNAQLNLEGRTHFADDATLRWHKARITGACAIADGLLFKLTESAAMDMHNTQRGFRVHVFDVFGTHVFGVDIDKASKTSAQADKVFRDAEFDILAHYKTALDSKRDWFLRDAATYSQAIAQITS